MMATFDNILLEGFRGKIDDFILYRHRGKTCLRSKPDKEKIIFTAGMLRQQERLSGVAALYQAVKAAGMLPIWQQAAEGTALTGYNLFVQRNVPAFTGEGNVVDFSKLQLSVGALPLPDSMRFVREGWGAWVLEWDNTTDYPGAGEDDRLVVALLKQEKGFLVEMPDTGDCRRKHGRACIPLPSLRNEYAHVYCYFCSAKDRKFSVSFYYLLFN